MIKTSGSINYRNLNAKEIKTLEQQNCNSIDGWESIFVVENFIPDHIKSTTFSGTNYIGILNHKISNHHIHDYSGIYNAHIHNCTIGNNSYIKNIGCSISNYKVEDNCILINIDSIQVNQESFFGNGEVINPINEAGGRDIYMYNELSVHTAYIMAFYGYKPELQKQLKELVSDYATSIKSSKGTIGTNSVIKNSGSIINVNFGSHCIIEGITKLVDGTVNSNQEAPSYVGFNVSASKFIFSTSSTVNDGAHLQHCFVGQGCEISNHFTAENSVFFSNSQCLQGEACAIFAGPYTVTHHKSSLLIAGYYSFFNAGSGTNQSNHMYKLGPVHQGIIERGSKTGSDSYILWPGKIGTFTMVLGRHYGNPDTSELPFSYLIEDNGKSVLMPAQNLFSVGTTRDVEKWPQRDKRKGSTFYDQVISEALNPFTINKIIQAIEVLKKLQDKASAQAKHVLYKNTQITLGSLNRGLKIYEQALIKYIGDELVNLFEEKSYSDHINNNKYTIESINQWIDLGGLICKESDILSFESKVISEEISISNLNSFFKKLFDNYAKDKKEHIFQVLKGYFDIEINSCSKEQIHHFIELWMENNSKITASIKMDAKKEFNPKTMIGFGQDGDEMSMKDDFDAVRGTFEENSFIKSLNKNLENNNTIGQKILDSLNN
ncbi:DUF4954 family protein [Plebeiibacterium sediminum]|uniref:DUF4954 family protein n=1 Tax=Plebeiibacterium sediminum TaxID=2992112 RepID=A0AAE3SGS0_9BACT|nr:DUF4954 family protein [Plebeiobacterium sediminum]MCW3788626.1 DUF4954 family protein [Plebeiobacterium sediminum]